VAAPEKQNFSPPAYRRLTRACKCKKVPPSSAASTFGSNCRPRKGYGSERGSPKGKSDPNISRQFADETHRIAECFVQGQNQDQVGNADDDFGFNGFRPGNAVGWSLSSGFTGVIKKITRFENEGQTKTVRPCCRRHQEAGGLRWSSEKACIFTG
jgi:hypothetical protein